MIGNCIQNYFFIVWFGNKSVLFDFTTSHLNLIYIHRLMTLRSDKIQKNWCWLRINRKTQSQTHSVCSCWFWFICNNKGCWILLCKFRFDYRLWKHPQSSSTETYCISWIYGYCFNIISKRMHVFSYSELQTAIPIIFYDGSYCGIHSQTKWPEKYISEFVSQDVGIHKLLIGGLVLQLLQCYSMSLVFILDVLCVFLYALSMCHLHLVGIATYENKKKKTAGWIAAA